MAQVSASTGLVSGINYGDIINQLMSIEQRPVNTLQTRIDAINQQRLAYTDLSTRLTSLKLSGTKLKKTATYQNATATSSDEGVLTATTTPGAAIGSYQLQVAQLVTTQQSVTRGFADFDSAKIGAGSFSLELGGGELTQINNLADLRGGAGVSRGVFKITDRSGATAVIDTSAAVSLDDVLKKINTNLNISVRASINNDKIVLTDLSGKTTSNLIVQDVGDGEVAADLGIVADTATTSVTGSDINYLGSLTTLAQLNDGRGIRKAPSGADFEATLGDGSTVDVTLASAKSVGDVVNLINTAGGSKLKAEITPGDNGIKLTDLTGGGGTFSIAELNGSKAATDLGIKTTGTAGVINGGPILAGLGTVLVSSLNGGQGLALGTISIQSRAASAGVSIDLSGAKNVADIIGTINSSGAGVTAALNSASNGIQITDNSGGTGNLIIGDTSGTSAAALGISGTFTTTTTTIRGANLQRQWVTENTLLADYNGGKGVSPGKFKITNAAGNSATIDLTQGNEIRLQDVIQEINSKGIGITASINAHGDGLLLTDATTGTGHMKVEDLEGTTATDLNIKGVATTNTIDGSFEKTITVTANDTLQTLQTKINDLNFGVTASIINDGSGLSPFRLAINAKNSGLDGRIVIDDGATTLGSRTLVQAQNAAVFIGGAGSSTPLLISASKNQLSGVIKGVNIDLNGVSDDPVTLNITGNVDNVVDEINTFTQNFNDMIDQIDTYTKWDTSTNTGGVLLGDSTAQTIQTKVYQMLQSANVGAGRYRILADVGITLGDGAKLQFDEEKFRSAFATDPDSVQKLFSEVETVTTSTGNKTVTPGLGYTIESSISNLIDPVNGILTRENQTLDQRTQQFQDRITQLNTLLDQKRTRLETQFANLESVLAGLQSQQTAIGQIKSVSAG